MPKRTKLCIESTPYQYKGKKLRLTKSYSAPNYNSSTILTDDPFTYVEFYFNTKKKVMRYRDVAASKAKFGDGNKYHYSFYWNQAKSFYDATKALPLDSKPLTAYYCMLNAVKAYLAYRSDYLEDFVESFSRHGLGEENQAKGTDLSTIAVYRQKQGVFPLFGKALEPDFDAIWPYGKNEAISLKSLLYNLAYIHRAYIVTYTEPKKAKIPEMFIPLPASKVPYYYKGNDSNLYMKIELDKNYFPTSAKTIPSHTMAGICSEFTVSCEDNFILQSVRGAKRNSSDSLSKEFKELNCKLRKEFQYIKSNNRLWYLKKSKLSNPDVVNLNSMLITMAAMHRISEIVRYKPEQLANLMKSKENWLLHEFITPSLTVEF